MCEFLLTKLRPSAPTSRFQRIHHARTHARTYYTPHTTQTYTSADSRRKNAIAQPRESQSHLAVAITQLYKPASPNTKKYAVGLYSYIHFLVRLHPSPSPLQFLPILIIHPSALCMGDSYSSDFLSGSGRIPSASSRLRASSRAQVCILFTSQLCPILSRNIPSCPNPFFLPLSLPSLLSPSSLFP